MTERNMKTAIKVSVPAKLNLGLRITGQRGGLHTLDSVMFSVNLYDRAEYIAGEKAEIAAFGSLDGFNSQIQIKNIENALFKLSEYCGARLEGRLTVYKNIPFGAGMGGSTAAVAAAVRAVAESNNIALDNRFLLSLGSDMPFMYSGGSARVKGVGEDVQALNLKKIYAVLVLPEGRVESAEAYAYYDKCGEDAGDIYSSLDNGVLDFGRVGRNALADAARALNPQVRFAEHMMFEQGGVRPLVTGSGSGVYCAYYDKEKAKLLFDALAARDVKVLLLESIDEKPAVIVEKK